MKIALLAPLRFPIREPYAGGLEWHTDVLATQLAERGHEVSLVAHPASVTAGRLLPVAVAADAGWLTYTRAIHAAVQRAGVGGFDLVHNNTIHFLPPLLAHQLASPMVTTLHTPPYRSHRFTARLTRPIGQHHYVSISHFLGRQWAPFVGESTVIHNGVDLATWPFSSSAEPATAVWYGRLVPDKGAAYAIAAARAAGYRLTLAGPVTDRAYFDSEIAPQLDDDIRYAGHLSQAELAVLVGRSAVGIVTSVWDEPFGLVYAEMLACGTPVAGFASGAAAEIVTPPVGTLVDKYDVAALARVLGEVERSKARGACRERIEESFQVSTMVDRYEKIYRACLG